MIAWRRVKEDLSLSRIERAQFLHHAAWRLLEEAWGNGESIGRIGRDKYNKPYLIDHPDVHFNLSHCDGMVACAMSLRVIGIDIEYIRPLNQSVLRKVCSMEEQEAVWQSENPDEYFFRLWTLKESYIKAVGKGLSLSMKNINFILGDYGEIQSNQTAYKFSQMRLGEKFILSVCEKI